VRLDESASFEVNVSYDAADESSGNRYVVQLGDERLTGSVEAGQHRWAKLGRVHFEPGSFEVRVVPSEIHGEELMRLRSVALSPVRGEPGK